MNFMKISNVLKSRFVSHTPIILSHRIISLCNCHCQTCDLWKKSSEAKYDLAKEEIFSLLKDAKDVGMIGYSVWGGEPLLHEDLPEILAFAKKMGLVNMLVTNGYLLKERHEEILSYTDFLTVSIDSNDDLHDKMRGMKGIRERAIEGIILCKKKGKKTKIIINTVINRFNYNKIEDLLNLSRELDVIHAFEPIDITEDHFKVSNTFMTTQEQLKEAFLKIIELKKKGYKVENSFDYLKNFSYDKKYKCHFPKILMVVDAHGNTFSCTDNGWGNVKDRRLKDIFIGNDFKAFCKRAEKCNKCSVSCVIESSFTYSLNPLFLLNTIRKLI